MKSSDLTGSGQTSISSCTGGFRITGFAIAMSGCILIVSESWAKGSASMTWPRDERLK